MSTEKLTATQVREITEQTLTDWLTGYGETEDGLQVQLHQDVTGAWLVDHALDTPRRGVLGTFRIRALVAEAGGQDELTALLERANKYLQPCGSCDAGLPTACVCAPGDPRAVLMDLVKLLGDR